MCLHRQGINAYRWSDDFMGVNPYNSANLRTFWLRIALYTAALLGCVAQAGRASIRVTTILDASVNCVAHVYPTARRRTPRPSANMVRRADLFRPGKVLVLTKEEQTRQAIGKRLREARTQMNLTQEQVAGDIGRSRQAVSAWERGETMPTLREFAALVEIYGVSSDRILFGVLDVAGACDLAVLCATRPMPDFERSGYAE